MILGSVQITHSVQTSVSVFRMLNFFQVSPDSYLISSSLRQAWLCLRLSLSKSLKSPQTLMLKLMVYMSYSVST